MEETVLIQLSHWKMQSVLTAKMKTVTNAQRQDLIAVISVKLVFSSISLPRSVKLATWAKV